MKRKRSCLKYSEKMRFDECLTLEGRARDMLKEGKNMTKEHFTVGEMLDMQKALQDKYKGQWEPICPGVGKNKLLWMIGEIGEVIDIIKKNGDEKAVKDEALRKDLVEEMADVLMYFNDVLLCYGISEEELKKSYTDKFERNMKRW